MTFQYIPKYTKVILKLDNLDDFYKLHGFSNNNVIGKPSHYPKTLDDMTICAENYDDTFEHWWSTN